MELMNNGSLVLVEEKLIEKIKNILLRNFLSILFILLAVNPSQSQDTSPNIVIITTDQQSADAMSFQMGKKWIDTPNIDKLAKEGVVFTRAYAANPLCVPSRNSMITGQYPHATGIQRNSDLADWEGSENHFWKKNDFKSMGTYFKNAGYETAYFGKWHLNYDPNNKDAHGFETVSDFPKPAIDDTMPGVVDKFLKKPHQKPLLIWASFINPHDICQWARFQKLPEGPIGKVPPVSEWPPLKDNLMPPKNETEAMTLARKAYQNNRRLFPVGNYSSFDWRRLAWGYYRLVEKIDERIGQLLEVLNKHGYDNNTLIVFTSDHGESLGAHQFNQKTVFYEESARVPFILKYEGKLNSGLNKTLVNTGTDLLPTLLEFANIKKPNDLPGLSLKSVAEKNRTFSERNYIVVENSMVQGGAVNGQKPVINGRMVRGKRFKYCLYDTLRHREALFDLKNDSGEIVNIARYDSSKYIMDKYRKYLKEFAQAHDDKKALDMLRYLDDK